MPTKRPLQGNTHDGNLSAKPLPVTPPKPSPEPRACPGDKTKDAALGKPRIRAGEIIGWRFWKLCNGLLYSVFASYTLVYWGSARTPRGCPKSGAIRRNHRTDATEWGRGKDIAEVHRIFDVSIEVWSQRQACAATPWTIAR